MKVFVAKSEIHGKGLFSNTDIKKGELIGNWTWIKPLTKEEVESDWCCEADNGGGCRLMTNEFKYMNHDRKNKNAFMYDDGSVVAIKRIKSGDEISLDYGDKWHELYSK